MGWKELVPLAFALRKEHIVRVNRRAVLINGIRQEAFFLGEPLRRYRYRAARAALVGKGPTRHAQIGESRVEASAPPPAP